ncbi:hypothetical protein PAESOLCIP111_01975 [Paenibacillus solanacearum]|uniref:Uncharacterized protein n=1 Tax=Paenibacillus solanacearum TaxID=2048548 RepID=A0A916JYX0_9BACL|nr:hypothetical protein [Paenibacillus solanacearum]CAG7617051.1 hypothetical protein PAESOLCIP111_01975 [Paenibacillus solanacearum]
MANPKTPNLGLNKIDRTSPSTTTFNTKTYLDDNADVIDEKFDVTAGHKHDGTAGNGPKLTASALANGAATDAVIGNRTVDQAIAAALADTGSVTQLLSFMAKTLKSVKGTENWKDEAATTLAAAYAHATNTSNPHNVTAAQIGAETPAGAQAKADNARKDSAKEFVLEVRTSDPASPVVGRIWYRSDLE